MTEDEALSLLLEQPMSFNRLLNSMKELREKAGDQVGSPTTLSNVLKDLARRSLARRDVDSRRWELTDLGCRVATRQGGALLQMASLSQLFQPCLREFENRPHKLIEIFAESLVAYETHEGTKKWSRQARTQLVEQTLQSLEISIKGNESAIVKLWSQEVLNSLNEATTLLAALCQLRLSLGRYQSSEEAAETIRKVVIQWTKFSSIELANRLAQHFTKTIAPDGFYHVHR